LTLLILGSPKSLKAWNTALRPTGLSCAEDGTLVGSQLPTPPSLEFIQNDGSFEEAFSIGNVSKPTLKAIRKCPAALVLTLTTDLVAGRVAVANLVDDLRKAGALAVRIEESKAGLEVQPWVDALRSPHAANWHQIAVVYMTSTNGSVGSCGMHTFLRPDVFVAHAGPGARGAAPAFDIATAFNMFQLVDDPILMPGHTFAPHADSPRYVLRRMPDMRYPSGHPCRNPFGLWQLDPAGDGYSARAQDYPSTIPVYIPTLVAVLSSLQAKLPSGMTLSREEVEKVRDTSPCLPTGVRAAQVLERQRGYADLDPENVWEQWQIFLNS
jgi:hypothetical protein